MSCKTGKSCLFCSYCESFCRKMLASPNRYFICFFFCRGKSKSRSKLKALSKQGSWLDGGRKAMIQHAGEFLRKMGEDLDMIAKEYSSSLDTFISQLPMQQHVDLKFLLFRLDFTEYYSRLSPGK